MINLKNNINRIKPDSIRKQVYLVMQGFGDIVDGLVQALSFGHYGTSWALNLLLIRARINCSKKMAEYDNDHNWKPQFFDTNDSMLGRFWLAVSGLAKIIDGFVLSMSLGTIATGFDTLVTFKLVEIRHGKKS